METLCIFGTFEFFLMNAEKKIEKIVKNMGKYMFKTLSNKNWLVKLHKLYFWLTKYITLNKCLIRVL